MAGRARTLRRLAFVGFFGFASLLFPLGMLVIGWQRFWGKDVEYVQTKAFGWVTLELLQGGRQLLDVPRSHESPGVADDLGKRARGGRDDRHTARHRFEDRQPKPLRTAREHERTGTAIEVDKVLDVPDDLYSVRPARTPATAPEGVEAARVAPEPNRGAHVRLVT